MSVSRRILAAILAVLLLTAFIPAIYAEESAPVDLLLGDADNNGLINNGDIAIILKYLAKWDVSIDLAAADVNGDGVVGCSDISRLLQYFTFWKPLPTPAEYL